jgi:hypothetical protein
MGVVYSTYAGHENGSSGFRAPTGAKYARKFRVSFDWLMNGRGSMLDGQLPPDEDELLTLWRQIDSEMQNALLTQMRGLRRAGSSSSLRPPEDQDP